MHGTICRRYFSVIVSPFFIPEVNRIHILIRIGSLDLYQTIPKMLKSGSVRCIQKDLKGFEIVIYIVQHLDHMIRYRFYDCCK